MQRNTNFSKSIKITICLFVAALDQTLVNQADKCLHWTVMFHLELTATKISAINSNNHKVMHIVQLFFFFFLLFFFFFGFY